MSNGTCVMSSEMNATSGVNEKSVLVPKNDLVLAFLDCASQLLFHKFFFSTEITVCPSCLITEEWVLWTRMIMFFLAFHLLQKFSRAKRSYLTM